MSTSTSKTTLTSTTTRFVRSSSSRARPGLIDLIRDPVDLKTLPSTCGASRRSAYTAQDAETRHNREVEPASQSTTVLVPPQDAQRVQTERGSLAYWELAPRVYMTEVRGFMTREMAQLIIELAEPLYSRTGRIHGFHNWLAMENYESVCRVDLTAWVMRHREQSNLHIGLRSRMVAMGVAVANLALGSLIQVHNEPKQLEAALISVLKSK